MFTVCGTIVPLGDPEVGETERDSERGLLRVDGLSEFEWVYSDEI